MTRTPLKERLERQIERIPEAGCWIFTGAMHRGREHHRHAYGVIGEGGDRARGAKVLLAHRAAWMVYRGPIPSGVQVLHRCDVPLCCNPDHLFLGSQTDNMQDCKSKGRMRTGCLPGDKNAQARLDWDKVREIRERYSKGATQTELAAVMGVSQVQIGRIIRRASWRE